MRNPVSLLELSTQVRLMVVEPLLAADRFDGAAVLPLVTVT